MTLNKSLYNQEIRGKIFGDVEKVRGIKDIELPGEPQPIIKGEDDMKEPEELVYNVILGDFILPPEQMEQVFGKERRVIVKDDILKDLKTGLMGANVELWEMEDGTKMLLKK